MSTIASYYMRLYSKMSKRASYCGLNYFLQIYINHALSCMHCACKKGCGHCAFSSRIIIIREGQVILPTRLRHQLDNKRLYTTRITFVADSQLAIYFAETTHAAIHFNYSQLHSQVASQLFCITRITSLAIASYIFCANYPVILFVIAIHSQLARQLVSQLATYLVSYIAICDWIYQNPPHAHTQWQRMFFITN